MKKSKNKPVDVTEKAGYLAETTIRTAILKHAFLDIQSLLQSGHDTNVADVVVFGSQVGDNTGIKDTIGELALAIKKADPKWMADFLKDEGYDAEQFWSAVKGE